ncbi:MAG: cell envelope integrity protein TolA [Telluria sp.]|nr:cell envelope integrity protein TolA [Telluria sp.]
MNPAAAGGVPYRVPPEPSRWPSITLAAVVHVGLLLFLWAGVSWQNTEPVAVEAEIWDMKVQSAAPPPPAPVAAPEPAPEPPPPAPKVSQPKVEEPSPPKPPDIALERAKLKAEKLKAEKLRQQEEKKQEEKKLAEEKDREKARELAEKKLEEKKLDEKKAAEKKARAKKEAAEQKALKDMRDAEMRRIEGAVGTTGTAQKASAPRRDNGYLASITSKIKSTTSYLGNTDLPGNPRAVFRIEELPTGEIISVKMIKSSGVPGFDEAVEKGIIKSSPLPKKKDGTVERSLEIAFSMKDLD